MTSRENLRLLGSAIFPEAISSIIVEKTGEMSLLVDRLKLLHSHHDLFILINWLAIPKLMYLLRTSPTWNCVTELRSLDVKIRVGLSNITNAGIREQSLDQATLPVKLGGLGIRTTEELSIPAFLASVSAVIPLVSGILPTLDVTMMTSEAEQRWTATTNLPLPSDEKTKIQKTWDEPLTLTRATDTTPESTSLHISRRQLSGSSTRRQSKGI